MTAATINNVLFSLPLFWKAAKITTPMRNNILIARFILFLPTVAVARSSCTIRFKSLSKEVFFVICDR
jgi:hypothetical protein